MLGCYLDFFGKVCYNNRCELVYTTFVATLHKKSFERGISMVGVKVRVRLDYSVNEVDLHVTKQCSGHCSYCYVDQCGESNELFKALP